MKLLFIGMDGLSHRNALYLQERFAPGMRAGLLKSLPGEQLTRTGPGWTSIYTGVHADQHGITSTWGTKEPGSGSLSFMELSYPCVWDYLNHLGLSTGVFGVPVTFPARKVRNGWMASGFFRRFNKSTNDLLMYPNDLWEGIWSVDLDLVEMEARRREAGGLGNKPASNIWNLEQMKDESHKIFHIRFEECLKGILAKRPVDCLFVSLEVFDRFGHWYLGSVDSESVRVLAGDWLRYLIDNFHAENVVVVADHGFEGETHSESGGVMFRGKSELPLPGSVMGVKDFTIKALFPEITLETFDGLTIPPCGYKDYLDDEKEKESRMAALKSLGYI